MAWACRSLSHGGMASTHGIPNQRRVPPPRILTERGSGAISLVQNIGVSDVLGMATTQAVRVDPVWDPLRNDPRFQTLSDKYGGNKAL
jgi:hypothetical protein